MPLAAPDPALDRLLFALALLKAASTVVLSALVFWRLRSPIRGQRAVLYITGAVAMIVATVLLFARAGLGVVPLLFDGGAATVVLLALTDAPMLARLTQRFPAFRGLRVSRTRRRTTSVRAAVGTPSRVRPAP